MFDNTGYITIGTSKDTSKFNCNSILQWWKNVGKEKHKNAESLLLLMDGGGSNSSRHHIFKQDLQELANVIGIEIRVAHYPPYTSKYNPIEHQLFSHITRACKGIVFSSTELVKELMGATTTSKGLKVIVNICNTVYELGRKATNEFIKNCTIIKDEFLPNWNYRAIPL